MEWIYKGSERAFGTFAAQETLRQSSRSWFKNLNLLMGIRITTAEYTNGFLEEAEGAEIGRTIHGRTTLSSANLTKKFQKKYRLLNPSFLAGIFPYICSLKAQSR
ncbi:hypothetical protein [Larkinella knui]|uniref:Uncharacterized protein n=1 Tax=Larkinella knui TaxID=2025310 RepID=A0A3P1CYB6_9BACT|nr:hypothetical protein [Larkinella knui]RRB18351.1 hypothetical protein EHT87_08800 [Larkinella knui]